jgi:hypothetical protein
MLSRARKTILLHGLRPTKFFSSAAPDSGAGSVKSANIGERFPVSTGADSGDNMLGHCPANAVAGQHSHTEAGDTPGGIAWSIKLLE